MKYLLTIPLLLLTLSACAPSPAGNLNADNTNINMNVQNDEIDTSTWKTYRNEEYGFEVRYPGEWRPDESKNNSIFFWRSISIEEMINEEIGAPLIIKIEKIQVHSVEEWFNNEFSNREKQFVPKYTQITIGKQSGIQLFDSFTIGGCEEDFIFTRDSYLFWLMRHSSTCDYSDKLYNKIISSLNFIDK